MFLSTLVLTGFEVDCNNILVMKHDYYTWDLYVFSQDPIFDDLEFVVGKIFKEPLCIQNKRCISYVFLNRPVLEENFLINDYPCLFRFKGCDLSKATYKFFWKYLKRQSGFLTISRGTFAIFENVVI
jgi:hypothetical protein